MKSLSAYLSTKIILKHLPLAFKVQQKLEVQMTAERAVLSPPAVPSMMITLVLSISLRPFLSLSSRKQRM